MNKLFNILFFSCVVFVSMSFTKTTLWYTFSRNDFSIQFPKKVETETKKIPSPIGELALEITMYETEEKDNDDNYVYGLITTEYPDSILNSSMKEKLPNVFRGAIDNAVSKVKGKLLTEKEIEINGYPGREIRVDFKDGLAIITMRCYLVKNKMFILQTIKETAKELNESSKYFFDSFKLNV